MKLNQEPATTSARPSQPKPPQTKNMSLQTAEPRGNYLTRAILRWKYVETHGTVL